MFIDSVVCIVFTWELHFLLNSNQVISNYVQDCGVVAYTLVVQYRLCLSPLECSQIVFAPFQSLSDHFVVALNFQALCSMYLQYWFLLRGVLQLNLTVQMVVENQAVLSEQKNTKWFI